MSLPVNKVMSMSNTCEESMKQSHVEIVHVLDFYVQLPRMLLHL